MPGPVLVIDAAGRPLMPLAAAHARKLLGRGRARRFAHPALTIIQLDYTVEEPVLRPVLVGVVVHTSTAEFFFLAASPRTTFPLLYVVLDRTAPQDQPSLRQDRAETLLTDHPDPLVSVLDSIRRFLPLSHLVLLQSDYQGQVDLRNWMQQAGIQELGLQQATSLPESLHSLYTGLVELVADPRRAAQTLVALPRPRVPHRRRSDTAPPVIGIIDTLGLVGILDTSNDANQDHSVLRVAVSAQREGITWQTLAVPSHTAVQQWSGGGVALIPVVRRSQVDQLLS